MGSSKLRGMLDAPDDPPITTTTPAQSEARLNIPPDLHAPDPSPPLIRTNAVTIRIFIYFLYELKDQPTVVSTGHSTMLDYQSQYQDHCFLAEIKIPAGKEFRFHVKVGQVLENGSIFTYRSIRAEYAHEGMVYLDFSNELFDSYYRNTTHQIDSSVPYQASAVFLASLCDQDKFEKEIDFFFGKLKEKTYRSTDLRLDISEFVDHLAGQPHALLKGIVLSSACSKYGIEINMSKLFSVDTLKNALPSFECVPQHIATAERLGLLNGCGQGKGLFYIIAALALAFKGLKESMHIYVRTFKLYATAKFTADEINILSSIDWKRYTPLSPLHFCGCIAAADLINQRGAVIPFLLGDGRNEYATVLSQMKLEDYIQV